MKKTLLEVTNDKRVILKAFEFDTERDAGLAQDMLLWLSDEFGGEQFCIGSRLS